MWTPYQTRNHNNNSNKLNGRQEMYSRRDYLRAVLELGIEKKDFLGNMIKRLICHLRFCTS
jgi:hypothetical protein